MDQNILIWDGEEFHHVTRDEADKLEKADKCQILSDGFIDGLALKYRRDFTGYKTREMRAEDSAKPAPAPAPKPAAKAKKKTARKSAKKSKK